MLLKCFCDLTKLQCYTTKKKLCLGCGLLGLLFTVSPMGYITTDSSSTSGLQTSKSVVSVWLGFTVAVFYSIVGSFGNLLTIVALLKVKNSRNKIANALILNLAAADFLFCAFNLPLIAHKFYFQTWVLGTAFCELVPFFLYGNLAVSVFNMLLITVNRYTAIVHHHVYDKIFQKWSVCLMVVFCWSFPFLLLMPQLIGVWGEFGYDNATSTCTFLEKDGKNSKQVMFVIGIAAPLLLMAPCYFQIYWTVQKSRKLVRRLSGSKSHCTTYGKERIKRDDRKLASMMTLVFGSFIICCIPVVIIDFAVDEQELPVLQVVASILTWTTCITNPFIYAFSNRTYRQAYITLFCSKSLKRTPTRSSSRKTSVTITPVTVASSTVHLDLTNIPKKQ